MKPLRQKRSEALERRKKHLIGWESTRPTANIHAGDGVLLEGEVRAAFLARKVEICKADIAKLESILESTY